MEKRALLLIGTAIAVVAAVAILMLVTDKPALHGSVITPAQPATEFRLATTDGGEFSLSGTRGKVVLLYFGYTNCPDECPLTMSNLKLAMGDLGKRASGAQVVMVTTDPARDSPQVLRDFLFHFDPGFLGLTGTTDQLRAIWRDYGVSVLDGGETHSNYVYVIDKAGNLVETFLPDSSPQEIAADIRILLDQD